jgi:glycosyltransferase involved in cell wall biosynthesis
MAGLHRILYLHSSDELYGADRSLLQLVTGLDRSRYTPLVILPDDLPYAGDLRRALSAEGVEVRLADLGILRRKYLTPFGLLRSAVRLFFAVIMLIGLIRRERISIVHSNTTAVIAGAPAAVLTGTPHIWHVREMVSSPRLLRRLTAFLTAHAATQVIAVSGPVRDHLIAGNRRNARHTLVVHNGVKLERFAGAAGSGAAVRRAWQVAADQPLIGMIGRVSRWKGQHFLLDAIEQVAAVRPAARFALVGSPAPGHEAVMQELRSRVAAAGLADRVIINEYRSDVAAVLDAFDVFVLPSIEPDPLPNVVLEAMAVQRPVIAAAHGGSLEMVEAGVSGLLVPPGDIAALTAAILQLIDQPALRQQFGTAGRARVEALFALPGRLAWWNTFYGKFVR